MLLFCLLGLHLQHGEVPRLGVELEVQLRVYTTVTATQDPSCMCGLHHSSWQHWILNPLSETRDQTHILMDTSRILNLLSHNGNSEFVYIITLIFKFFAGKLAIISIYYTVHCSANAFLILRTGIFSSAFSFPLICLARDLSIS